MPNSWKRMAAPLVLAGLLLLALVAMLSDRGSRRSDAPEMSWWEGVFVDAMVVGHKVLSAPVDGVRSAWDGYFDLVGVREQNAQLESRVSELEEAVLHYREALVTSGHLQRIAEMRKDFELPMLPSEVVGFDSGPIFRSVLVDRGRRDGVDAGQPVITEDGVVGLVTATSRNSARAMLVLDSQSAIDAFVQRSRIRGIVRGRGTGSPEFGFVARGADVEVGDLVVTSGLGGVYPKGLRLGTIEAVREVEGRLLGEASMRPAVDFGRLEQVFVMLWRAPSMDLLYGDEGDAPMDLSGVESP